MSASLLFAWVPAGRSHPLAARVALELKGCVANADASEGLTRGSQNGARVGTRRCLEVGRHDWQIFGNRPDMEVVDSPHARDRSESGARLPQRNIGRHAFAQQVHDLADQAETKNCQQDRDGEAGHGIGDRRPAGENNERRRYNGDGAESVTSEVKDEHSRRPCASFAPMHDEGRCAVHYQTDDRDSEDHTSVDRRRSQEPAHALHEDDRGGGDQQDRVRESSHRLQSVEAVGVVFIGFARTHVGCAKPHAKSYDVDQDVGGVAQERQATGEQPTTDLDPKNRQ